MKNKLSEKELPIGGNDFSDLRRNNQIYVDKTDVIYEMCRHKISGNTFSRPDGFGKTLLTSTFESLFRYGLRDFKGLAIEKLWDDTTYNVLRLDFSSLDGFTDIDAYRERASRIICDSFARCGLGEIAPPKRFPFDSVIDWMITQPDCSLVLLIDGVDVPLCASKDDAGLFGDVVADLSTFFAGIKAYSSKQRFCFMVGNTRMRYQPHSSFINHLLDVTDSPTYDKLLGYTEDDIRTYFSDYLARAADLLGDDIESLVGKLRECYGNYYFGRTRLSEVFAPEPLLAFLNDPKSVDLDAQRRLAVKPDLHCTQWPSLPFCVSF